MEEMGGFLGTDGRIDMRLANAGSAYLLHLLLASETESTSLDVVTGEIRERMAVGVPSFMILQSVKYVIA